MVQKLLLTGGSGMVGRNILDHPGAADWEILSPSSRELNLMDAAAVEAYVKETMPDLIVHAAGKVGGIRANMAAPVAFLDWNATIGRNLLIGARSAGVRRLINLASTCIYPRSATNPLKESAILTGELEPTNEGYALAKLMILRLCQYIRREDASFLYKTLIPCNLYGPYDKFDPAASHLVPAIIDKIHKAKIAEADTVEIWGDGTARREFMYASDLAEAIFKAAADLEAMPDLMNVGVGTDHSINDYYHIVRRVIGWEGGFTHDLTKPVGMDQKLCDTIGQSGWGWQPTTSLDAGIEQTYQYYLRKAA